MVQIESMSADALQKQGFGLLVFGLAMCFQWLAVHGQRILEAHWWNRQAFTIIWH